MMINRWAESAAFALLALAAGFVSAQEELPSADSPSIVERLGEFEVILGKTWIGTFANATAENPVEDVLRWELTLGGKAIRATHSVNDGAYAGETLVYWDAEQEKLVFWYVTTADFYTVGTLTVEGEVMRSHSVLHGGGPISEVKGETRLLEGGGFLSTSSYKRDGEWVEGNSITYVEQK